MIAGAASIARGLDPHEPPAEHSQENLAGQATKPDKGNLLRKAHVRARTVRASPTRRAERATMHDFLPTTGRPGGQWHTRPSAVRVSKPPKRPAAPTRRSATHRRR